MCSLARPLVRQAPPGRARHGADGAVPGLDRYPSPMSGTVVSQGGSGSCVRLAVNGWCIRRHVQPDGRTVIEVSDETGVLTGLVVGTRLPIVSADAAWRGIACGAGGARRWWALAIGHVPADAGQPTVTFTRRTRHRPGAAPPDAVDGLWFAHDGLWVAAATGHHTLARLTTRSATQVRRLRPVTALRLRRSVRQQ